MKKICKHCSRALKIVSLAILWPASANAVEFELDRTQSVFAMVTHKAGIAAHLAHEHFIAPASYTVNITADQDITENADAINSGHFELNFLARNLVADDPVEKQRWNARIQNLAILDHSFPVVPDDARKKIYETMLSAEQLDAASFPNISLRTTGIQPAPSESSSATTTHDVSVEMTVHGRTMPQTCPAAISWQGNMLAVEAKCRFNFTDFGIKPYSALFGAIRNQDRFHLYVNFIARQRGV